jgi:hypothetical protein
MCVYAHDYRPAFIPVPPREGSIARYVEQGLRDASTIPVESVGRHRSDLPVARPASGRPLPVRSGEDIAGVLDGDGAADA